MFKVINIFEIILDYFRNMKKDLKTIPFLANLLVIPLAIAAILYFSVNDFRKFAQIMITVTSIFIPLLLNVLIIVHYSIERTIKNKNTKNDNFIILKLEFLKHVSSTASMVVLVSTFILFLSIILVDIDYKYIAITKYIFKIKSIVKSFLMFLVGFMFVNIIITFLRVYRLINFEIKEYQK